MSDLTLKNVRIATWWDTEDGRVETLGRPATVEDLREVLEGLGAEVLEPSFGTFDEERWHLIAPGRYLVWRLPEEETYE